ncbi:MAG: CcdB family protein [Betaproteobacteria bacterium]|nr:CcdB family protein [Betaproteobacteria bacterium]
MRIGGERVVMLTRFTAAMPAPILKLPVHDLADRRNDITAAVDLLFQGFQAPPGGRPGRTGCAG